MYNLVLSCRKQRFGVQVRRSARTDRPCTLARVPVFPVRTGRRGVTGVPVPVSIKHFNLRSMDAPTFRSSTSICDLRTLFTFHKSQGMLLSCAHDFIRRCLYSATAVAWEFDLFSFNLSVACFLLLVICLLEYLLRRCCMRDETTRFHSIPSEHPHHLSSSHCRGYESYLIQVRLFFLWWLPPFGVITDSALVCCATVHAVGGCNKPLNRKHICPLVPLP